MFTIKVIFFSLLPLVFFGVPLSGILFPREPISERWVKVPFIGMAWVVLIVQNLIYADIPVKESAPWVWGLGLILWGVYLFLKFQNRPLRFRFDLKRDLLFVPVILLFIYVVQGFGMFGSSARFYGGRAWFDQYNYVSMAQFMADHPFSTSAIQVADQPYAQKGVSLKYDRIGQSAYHAFVLASAQADAKSTFEVVIFIYPMLVAVAVFWIASSLFPARLALMAMFWAGILPSLTMVHLESFLSQALGTPFLFIFPLFLQDVREKYSTRAMIAAAIILAAGVGIYTELLLLYLAEIFLVFLAWAASQPSFSVFVNPANGREYNIKVLVPEKDHFKSGMHLFANYIFLLLISIIVNIGFWASILQISKRISAQGQLTGIYPWAYSPEGIARLWFGDWSVLSPPAGVLLAVLGIFLTAIAYTGLFLNWSRHKQSIRFTILALCVLPLGLPILGEGYQYQFYKLLLTISPLFVIGLVYVMEESHFSTLVNRVFRIEKRLVSGKFLLIVGVILMLSSGGSALNMTYLSGFGKSPDELGRGGSFLLNTQATRDVESLLRSVGGQQVLISYRDDFFDGRYLNGWLAYFARNNQVFLTNPAVTDISVPDLNQLGVDIGKLPDGSLIIHSSKYPCNGEIVGTGSELLLKNNLFVVRRISGNEWAFVDQFLNPNGVEANYTGSPVMWVGNDPASVVVYSGRAGVLNIDPIVYLGPSLPEGGILTLEISSSRSIVGIAVNREPSNQPVGIPILPGRNDIQFRVLENPTRRIGGDAETHLVNLSNICQISIK